jgi:hypothetical protein
MLKLVKLLVFAALLAAGVFLLPIEGRTLYDRWLEAAPRKSRPEPKGAPRATRDPPAGKEPPARDRPLERTTDSERKALDKLLEKELADAPRR